MELTIRHNKEKQEFIAIVDGKACVLNYSILPDAKTLDYYRTFVPDELRGQHIGDKIVIYALDYAKQNNHRIIPSCPFVELVIKRHPEYKTLIATDV